MAPSMLNITPTKMNFDLKDKNFDSNAATRILPSSREGERPAIKLNYLEANNGTDLTLGEPPADVTVADN